MHEQGPIAHIVHELVSQYSQLSAHSLWVTHQTTAAQNTRVSPCANNTCRSQRCRLRADDHPVWTEDTRTDREQPQNIFHTSSIFRLQEERHRVRVCRVLVQENCTYYRSVSGSLPPEWARTIVFNSASVHARGQEWVPGTT